MNSEYEDIIRERYKKEAVGFVQEEGYEAALILPKKQGTEKEMLAFVKANPNATLREVVEHIEEIVPEDVRRAEEEEFAAYSAKYALDPEVIPPDAATSWPRTESEQARHDEYADIIADRFWDENMTYETSNAYYWAMYAPERHGVEQEMLDYVKDHPKATLREVIDHYDEISPPGGDEDLDDPDLEVYVYEPEDGR